MSDHTEVPTTEAPEVRSAAGTPDGRLGRRAAAAIGGLVHAALGVTTAVSGLIMPDWAVRVLALVWIAGVALMIRSRRNPVLVIVIPVALWATWFAVVFAGQTWLGWTA